MPLKAKTKQKQNLCNSTQFPQFSVIKHYSSSLKCNLTLLNAITFIGFISLVISLAHIKTTSWVDLAVICKIHTKKEYQLPCEQCGQKFSLIIQVREARMQNQEAELLFTPNLLALFSCIDEALI